MDKLITALGPAFAAGFAVQQLLEILDPLVVRFVIKPENKKLLMGLISLVVGFGLTAGLGLHVLLAMDVKGAEWADIAVTTLIISAGTEGINSIIKFLGYAKEDKKAEAAQSRSTAEANLPLVNRQPVGR